MNNKPLISIIVPVYNVEQYLPRCLDSILAQTFTDFEVIAIDDGSPDNCGKILDEYAEKDNRIKVIHKENGGVSSARNAGLDVAIGEYIGFVDPDDVLAHDMYEHLISEVKTGNFDMVQCSYKLLFEDGTTAPQIDIRNSIYTGYDEIVEALVKDYIVPCLWLKLMKRSVIGEIKFDTNLTIAEDLLFVYNFIKKARSVKTTDKIGYYYFQREVSAVRSDFDKRAFDDLYVNEIMLSENRDKKIADVIIYRDFTQSYVVLKKMLINALYMECYPEIRKRILNYKKNIFFGKSMNSNTGLRYYNVKSKIFVLILMFFPWGFNKYFSKKGRR